MPTSPPSLCATPGCPNLVTKGKCAYHQRETRRDVDARRPTAHHRGYDHTWRATRNAYLNRHPYCEQPNCDTEATDVDHIDGLGPHGPRGHDFNNLQALCHSHHATKTVREDGGFGRPKGQGSKNL